MRPATREGALELVAEIIDRGLRRREQRVARPRKRRKVRDAAMLNAKNADPDSRRSSKTGEATSDVPAA
jgi:hypothetical protein